jgi:fumarate hydratase class II
MGAMEVPADALYGAQTARAVANFPISGQGLGREMIQALGWIKLAAAGVNRALGRLEPRLASAIQAAAREVAEGLHDAHFPVDVFQTGSGTSSNMNANEVIANLANLRLGGRLGDKAPVHPNDHVNLGQSSNDVFPSAVHLAALGVLERRLLPALQALQAGLVDRAAAFDGLIKIGRTHLQDATPMTLAQEVHGWAAQVGHGRQHLVDSLGHLRELALGGTAVGTGQGTHPEFGARMAAELGSLSGLEVREAADHFEAQGAQDAAVATSGALRGLAVALIKIANDIRWLGSGPRLGLGELRLPEVQPGSSIMPGKVNPVLAEALVMACVQVIADDQAIALGGLLGNLELNTLLPLIGRNLLEQGLLLSRAIRMFDAGLVRGLQADRDRLASQNERALMLVTALVPRLGYDRAAEVAREALRTGRTIREVALEGGLFTEAELAELLDLGRMLGPGGGG